MASHEPRITEEEMQYYQFKARQMFLLKKEDHEWNQFCKRNICTCCLCTPVNQEEIKNVGIQTSDTNVQRGIRRNFTYRPSNNKNLPNSLIEIKEKLDKLDLSLAKVLTFQEKEVSDILVPSKLASAKSSASDKNAVKDDRLDIIHNALKGSLLRLQSAATWKESSSAPSQKKGSGFVLPRGLQDQRIIARRAYLASLEKLKSKSETIGGTNSSSKMTNLSKRPPQKLIPKKPKPALSNLHRDKKDQKKVPSVPQKKKQGTESDPIMTVQSNEIKDENIENAIDVMIDDLIGETALSVNKIKYMKTLKKSENQQTEGKDRLQLTCKKGKLREERTSHSSHWEKIRSNLSCLKSKMDIVTEDTDTKTSCEPEFETKQANEQPTLLQNIKAQTTVSSSTSLEKTKIYITTKSVKEISKQRKEFQKYLESISRTQKGNFNPWTLSNMVAESLLDDCILDVSKELQDIPSDMIMGLYDQEFLMSLTDN